MPEERRDRQTERGIRDEELRISAKREKWEKEKSAIEKKQIKEGMKDKKKEEFRISARRGEVGR